MNRKKIMTGAAVVALVITSLLYSGGNTPLRAADAVASSGSAQSSGFCSATETLPEDVSARLLQLDENVRRKLTAEPRFCWQVMQAPPSVRVKLVDQWVDWLSDNFCREFLTAVSLHAYSTDGLKRLDLPVAKAGCPKGVSLDETLRYVNEKLGSAFHDEFTLVRPPESAKAFSDAMAGKALLAGGIGVSFTLDRSWLVERKASESGQPVQTNSQAKVGPVPAFTGLVFHVISGGPAAAAGLKDGDVIEKADGATLIGLDNNYVIEHFLRGAPGTQVTFTVKRGDARFEAAVVRAPIAPDTIWGRRLDNGVYAIIVQLWQEGSAQKIYDELMTAKNIDARGIVIDLRGNPGGYVEEALQSASYFIENGVVVRAHERSESEDELAVPEYHSHVWERRGGNLFMGTRNDGDASGKFSEVPVKGGLSLSNPKTGKTVEQAVDIPFIADMPPVVVLGDGGSASASELFIGTLKQNARRDGKQRQGGKFVGEPTFGKGIKQDVVDAPLGTQISATSGRYYLPDGYWPGDAGSDRRPIKPDVEVAQPKGALVYTASDAQLNRAIELINEEAPAK